MSSESTLKQVEGSEELKWSIVSSERISQRLKLPGINLLADVAFLTGLFLTSWHLDILTSWLTLYLQKGNDFTSPIFRQKGNIEKIATEIKQIWSDSRNSTKCDAIDFIKLYSNNTELISPDATEYMAKFEMKYLDRVSSLVVEVKLQPSKEKAEEYVRQLITYNRRFYGVIRPGTINRIPSYRECY